MSRGGHETFELTGLDLHTHPRQPSPINKSETLESCTKALASGGWVMGGDMSNNPGYHTNSVERILEKHTLYYEHAFLPMITFAGAQPEYDNVAELSEMMRHAMGAKFYGDPSTDVHIKHSVKDFEAQTIAIHEAAPDKPIFLHSGSDNLEEFIGLVSIDNDHHLHVCHNNNPNDIEMINRYKAKGYKISSGICVHHMVLDSLDTETRGPFAEMLPPLARQVDVEKLVYQFAEGLIDSIETDHAPHSYEAKMAAESDGTGCAGVPGAQHSLPVLFYKAKVDSKKSARKGLVTMERIDDAVDKQTQRISGVKISSKTKVIWSDKTYRIEREDRQVESGAKWTPFLGMMAVGEVLKVTVGGVVVYQNQVFKDRAPKAIIRRGTII